MINDTDRELLELAAKAYDLENPRYVENTSWGTGISHGNGDQVYSIWNPLTDDGDAFRLAVKLKMVIDTDYNGGAIAGNATVDCEYDCP